ncbi:pheromone A receptor-domain-containing protein [Aspergillus avenaceus]|uniref:Pheromone A receptor-domain-containing protein n=1 Tax=Aspergillus avenaceus TaxID=36643 RepID=A0A5N6TQM0_ASPAV|nr:pheromone A receptor-domain-containing protein [Aspergillus avenaceus]
MASTSTPIFSLAVVIPFLSMLSMFLSIVPLVLHWNNRNLPATTLIVWFYFLNLFNIINAFIWPNDDMDTWWSGAGLCDVEVKIMVASYVGVPGCLLCIFRNLAYVLDTRRATLVPTKRQRWWNIGMDALFCVIVPVLAMITHIVYQASRYILGGISGCINSYDESWMSLVLAWIWPLIICLIGGYYCSLVLHRLHKYRSQFSDILQSSNSNLNQSRFMRLFCLSFIMLLAIIPAQVWVVYKNVSLSLPWHPYSWSVAHGPNWNTIIKMPSHGEPFFDRWFPIASGFMFFIFFGCGRDASKMYRKFLRSLRVNFGFSKIHTSVSDTSRSTASGSVSSRAKLLMHRSRQYNAATHVGRHTTKNVAEESSRDVEKAIASPACAKHGQSSSWLKGPWVVFSRSHPSDRERRYSLPELSVPSNTVSANAWAGTSQSRGSNDFTSTGAFIRVKQDIRQESEVQR